MGLFYKTNIQRTHSSFFGRMQWKWHEASLASYGKENLITSKYVRALEYGGELAWRKLLNPFKLIHFAAEFTFGAIDETFEYLYVQFNKGLLAAKRSTDFLPARLLIFLLGDLPHYLVIKPVYLLGRAFFGLVSDIALGIIKRITGPYNHLLKPLRNISDNNRFAALTAATLVVSIGVGFILFTGGAGIPLLATVATTISNLTPFVLLNQLAVVGATLMTMLSIPDILTYLKNMAIDLFSGLHAGSRFSDEHHQEHKNKFEVTIDDIALSAIPSFSDHPSTGTTRGKHSDYPSDMSGRPSSSFGFILREIESKTDERGNAYSQHLFRSKPNHKPLSDKVGTASSRSKQVTLKNRMLSYDEPITQPDKSLSKLMWSFLPDFCEAMARGCQALSRATPVPSLPSVSSHASK